VGLDTNPGVQEQAIAVEAFPLAPAPTQPRDPDRGGANLETDSGVLMHQSGISGIGRGSPRSSSTCRRKRAGSVLHQGPAAKACPRWLHRKHSREASHPDPDHRLLEVESQQALDLKSSVGKGFRKGIGKLHCFGSIDRIDVRWPARARKKRLNPCRNLDRYLIG
jgi:hypothetical protein